MTTENLYEAITLIDDDLIDEAGTYAPKKRNTIPWKHWAGTAACLALVVGFGSAALGLFGLLGGNSAADGEAPTAFEDRADSGDSFMAYAGPVFPLSTLEAADGLTAQREITLDFANWAEKFRGSDITVEDAYTLTNTTAEDKTITLLYPFVSSLTELDKFTPVLTVSGTEVKSDLIYGLYSGGFQGVLGTEDAEGSLNLNQLNSWEEYKTLLSDGSYLQQSIESPPDLTGIDVIVYEFIEPWGKEENPTATNPTIRVTFDMDYDKTTVLSSGFRSGRFDRDNGKMGCGFSIPRYTDHDYGQPRCIILLGDDVENMEIEGYVTGGWGDDETLSQFGVDVQRYETDLDTILRKTVSYLYNSSSWHQGDRVTVDFETYYGLFCDYLTTYGVLSEDGRDRYENGWLDELSEMSRVDRVCYLQAEVTIPAGDTVEITALMTKEGSYNHFSSSSKNQNTRGYDLLTVLGTTLSFTDQSATLLDHGLIEIVRQNFGFDLVNDIKTAELDLAVEHYYLEVKRSEN